MKDWEAKFLGFTLAWWLLLLPFIGGPLGAARTIVAVVGLPVGLLVAASVSGSHKPGSAVHIANWFLLAVASMLVVGFAGFLLMLGTGVFH